MGAAPPGEAKFVTWTVNVHHARSLPRLDLCAHSIVPEADLMRHRWIRSSPRYLGKMAQRGRGVAMTDLELERFRDKAAEVMRDSLRGPADGVPLMVQIRSVGAES